LIPHRRFCLPEMAHWELYSFRLRSCLHLSDDHVSLVHFFLKISVVKDPLNKHPSPALETYNPCYSCQWQIAPFTPIVTPFLHPRHVRPITSKTIQRITHVSAKKQPHTATYTVPRFDSQPEIWGTFRSLMRVRQTDFQEKVDAKFTFHSPCEEGVWILKNSEVTQQSCPFRVWEWVKDYSSLTPIISLFTGQNWTPTFSALSRAAFRTHLILNSDF